jgi:hypothetical protein
MPDVTLESLAQRVAELEKLVHSLTTTTQPKDWRWVAGMFSDTEFSRELDAAVLEYREQDRRAAGEEADQ